MKTLIGIGVCVCLCFLGMGGCLYITASGDAKVIAAERGTAWQTNTITVTNHVVSTNQTREQEWAQWNRETDISGQWFNVGAVCGALCVLRQPTNYTHYAWLVKDASDVEISVSSVAKAQLRYDERPPDAFFKEALREINARVGTNQTRERDLK